MRALKPILCVLALAVLAGCNFSDDDRPAQEPAKTPAAGHASAREKVLPPASEKKSEKHAAAYVHGSVGELEPDN